MSFPFTGMDQLLIPGAMSNYIYDKVWDEIAYPFPNVNTQAAEVWELISNFIPHFTVNVISYPCYDLCSSMLVIRAPGQDNSTEGNRCSGTYESPRNDLS